jgi:hypothetical protein
MKTKRTEITIEVEEVIHAANYRHPLTHAWCPDCGDLVPMLRPEPAAGIAGKTVREVNQLVEAGCVHFLETPDGLLLVCVNSLSEPIPLPLGEVR